MAAPKFVALSAAVLAAGGAAISNADAAPPMKKVEVGARAGVVKPTAKVAPAADSDKRLAARPAAKKPG